VDPVIGRESSRSDAADVKASRTWADSWRADFPYGWDADELVSRRWLLRFVVYTSGALFAATTVLAALGLIRRPEQAPATLIARVGDVPASGAHYFRYPGPEDEAVLLRLPDGRFAAYSQKCTHLSCSVFYETDKSRLYCPCHEGVFDPVTGEPVAGPPSRRLPKIVLRREGDALYAVGREL
jgi:Rieske Fe-S protein